MFGSIKRLIKYISAIFFYYSGLLVFLSILRRIFARKNDFTILMYHRVLDDNDLEKNHTQPGLYVSRSILDSQMSYISKKYEVLTLKELTDILSSDRTVPSKCVVITFDDGWRDNYLYAYPILKKYNLPAIIFLTTDFIDSGEIFWFIRVMMICRNQNISPFTLAGILKKRLRENEALFQNLNMRVFESEMIDLDSFIEIIKYFDIDIIKRIIVDLENEGDISAGQTTGKAEMLNWGEILEMSNNMIEFGSHGCSHRILTRLSLKDVEREVIESKKIIEEKLNIKCEFFSYPNGDHNEEIAETVRKAGFAAAVSTVMSLQGNRKLNNYTLKRIGIHDGAVLGPTGKFSKAIFACLLEKIF